MIWPPTLSSYSSKQQGMTNKVWKFTSKTNSITLSCKTGSIRPKKQTLRGGRHQRKRWHVFECRYPLQPEQSTNKVQDYLNRIRTNHTWLSTLGKSITALASGNGQKFLSLLQNEEESIASWETRIRNQAAQCEYGNFADELMREQFIEPLRIKLIGKGQRHRDTPQAKATLREVTEVAKSHEATTLFCKPVYEKCRRHPAGTGKLHKEDKPQRSQLGRLNSTLCLVLQ